MGLQFPHSDVRVEVGMRIGVLQLDDVRLGFEYREGDGVPIVFMGGVTSTTATWEPVLERLETCLLYTSPSPRD